MMDENQNIILPVPDIVQSTHNALMEETATPECNDRTGWKKISGVTGNLNLVSELGTIDENLVLESHVDQFEKDKDRSCCELNENLKDNDGIFSVINSEEINPEIPVFETCHLNEALSHNKNRKDFVNVDNEEKNKDGKYLNQLELKHCLEHAVDSELKTCEKMDVSSAGIKQFHDLSEQTCDDHVQEKTKMGVHRKRGKDKQHNAVRVEIQKKLNYDRVRLKLSTRDKLSKLPSHTNLSENTNVYRNSYSRYRNDKLAKTKTYVKRKSAEFSSHSKKGSSKSKRSPSCLAICALDKNAENVDVFRRDMGGYVQDPKLLTMEDFQMCRVKEDFQMCRVKVPYNNIRHCPKWWDNNEIRHSDCDEFYGRILCAERVTQMTRTYNDIEAVNRLLEEKERDLELAARIGQTLLQKNQDLTDKNESLEEQVSQATEKLNQFKHEILRKDELLQALTHSESDSTPTDDSPNGNCEGLYTLGASSLQKKVKSLEEENIKLRIETVQLSTETSEFEEKEQKLVSDCLEQLGEVKDQLEVYSQELAQKTEETHLQKEEITNLLAQLVDVQRKCKVLTAENLELQKHLEASQSAQKHLTKELAEYKDKHDEVLELLEENQEELRRLRRKHKPNVAKHSYLSTSLLSVPNDSIASELESSLKSEIDFPIGFSPAERKVHNWRIFETAKAAKKASNKHNVISNSNSFGTEKTSGISGMSGLSGLSTLSLNDSLDSGARSPGLSGAASSVGRPGTASAGMSNRSSMYFSECESVQSDGYTADLDSLYGDVKKHSLGRPGIPGSNDLETALRKLSIRRANELNEEDFFEDEEKRKRQRHRSDTSRSDAQESTDTPGMCPTPDSTLSTGSFRSGFSQLSYPGSNNPHYRLPEKLKIIKPLEGSVTLRHWQQLATPHLGGIFESRPGVQIKGERKLDLNEEVYNLSDFEEDDDYEDNTECYKRFQESSTINTYTNSTVKHPTQLVSEDESELDSDIECAESTSTKSSTPRLTSMVQSSGTTTYSMSLGLAAILNERDLLSPTDKAPQTSGAKQTSNRSGCLVSESHFDLAKSKAQAVTVSSSSGAGVALTTSSPTKTSPEKPNSLSGADYQEANLLNRIKNTGFSLYGYLGKFGQRSDSVVSLPASIHKTNVSQEGAIPKVSSVNSGPTQSSSVDNLVTIVSAPDGKSEAAKSTSTSAIFGSGASGGGVLGALTSIRKSGIF